MVSAIVLGAGESKRMGSFKQLQTIGARTILALSVESLLGTDVDEVILVLGCRHRDVLQSLGVCDRRLKIVDK